MEQGKTKKEDAFARFPELFSQETRARRAADKSYINVELNPITRSSSKHVQPPSPPDISWLRSGEIAPSNEEAIDIPPALVLVSDENLRNEIISVIQAYGYLIETVETPLEAIHRLSFSNYGIVIMHTGFEDKLSFADSVVHRYLCRLPMSRRRRVHYIIIGPEMCTGYELMALSLSANLLVNEDHVKHLEQILKKGFREYEELFGPLIEQLQYKM